jgi:hypothetical protein
MRIAHACFVASCVALWASALPARAQDPQPPRDLAALLAKDETGLADALRRHKELRIQILVGEPQVRDDGKVTLRRSRFGDPRQYFYPASTVKLGAAVAALLELQRLSREQQDPFTLDAKWRALPRFPGDAVDPPWIPIADDLRAMLIVSDNPPYNRCFELLSQKGLNDALWRAGLSSARMWHRLSEPRTVDEHRLTRQLAIHQGDTSLAIAPREAGALYKFPAFGLLALGVCGVALGNARGALDAFHDLATVKKSQGSAKTLSERQSMQAAYATCEAQWRAARAYLFSEIDRVWAIAGQSDEIPMEIRADLRLACTHMTRTGADICRTLYDLGGGAALFESSDLQRRFRDAHAITQHIVTAPSTLELTGRILFRLPTDSGMV